MATALARRMLPRAPTPHPCRPLSSPQTLAAALQEAAPNHPCTAPPLGDLPPNPPPLHQKSEREEEGRSWSRWGVPFVEEPEVSAPLGQLVAARPAGEAAGRGCHARTVEGAGAAVRPGAGAARGRKKPVQPLLPLLQPVRHRPLFCLLFTELFNTASPERQGAGLQHREDVAVEAMDRAALLPLLQAVPRCSSPPPRRRVQGAR
jgi:hypothetical protein